MKQKNVLIMGAAGRDFHNFNVVFRDNALYRVKAFTAAQIPFIADRRYPTSLAGTLYPAGIPIYAESELERLIAAERINEVIFSYSDISHEALMHKASIVLARGADFRLIGPDATMLQSRKLVVSVCAVRTGCGKSELTRYLCGVIRTNGVKPVVVRHPMPYGNLEDQAVERFANFEDLSHYKCTVEEREEYEPLIRQGTVVFAGVDYERILQAAEQEGDVIIWDGGNNDFSFFRPDLEITVADPLRTGDETSYFPGEVNLRRAHIVVINKINTADQEHIHLLENTIKSANPASQIFKTSSKIAMHNPGDIKGKTVLVIEDGPSITHGKMPSGAGWAAAKEFEAGVVIDPRPYAVGSIADVFRQNQHIGHVLPAMGYSPEQIEELRQTIEAVPCEYVLSATPIDISRFMSLTKPVKRVSYDIVEEQGSPLKTLVSQFCARNRR
jgi:predicted GTPase